MTAVSDMTAAAPSPTATTKVRRSRIEVDVRRLLTCCEQLAQDHSPSDWRLAKYLQALDGMMQELQRQPS